MSFSYSAAGTREEVVPSLDSLSSVDLGNDGLGGKIRDAIADAISIGTDMTDPSDQRYQVNVSGHSGHGSVVTLNATVKVVSYTPPEEAQTVPLADTASAQDNVTAAS